MERDEAIEDALSASFWLAEKWGNSPYRMEALGCALKHLDAVNGTTRANLTWNCIGPCPVVPKGTSQALWESFDDNGGTWRWTYIVLWARKTGWLPVREELLEESSEHAGLRFVDFSQLQECLPPPMQWVVKDWIPRGCLTALFGPGGHGKSLVAQQLALSVANGREWLSLDTTRGPVVGLFCEDDDAELLRRGSRIRDRCGAEEISKVHLSARAGMPNVLVRFSGNAHAATSLLLSLREQCAAIRPVLLILDNIAQLFAGNENDRSQVTLFCNECTALAREFNCGVLLLGHPAKAQRSEYSGSTAWEAAVRSRLFLERQDDGMTLLRKAKANYAELDEIRLTYRGIFTRVAQTDDVTAVTVGARNAILRALDIFTQRRVGTSSAPTARNNLVTLMHKEALLDDISPTLARRVLGQMIDRGELAPDRPLGWHDRSRHTVRGLARTCGASDARHLGAPPDDVARSPLSACGASHPCKGVTRAAPSGEEGTHPEVERTPSAEAVDDAEDLV